MQTKRYEIVFHDDQEFPLRVSYEMQRVTSLHTHQFAEIVIVISGTGIHETQFARDKIAGGDVIVIPKDGYHRYAEVDNLELMNLLFDAEKLPLPLIDLYKLPGFNALFSISNEYFNKNQFYPKFRLEGRDFEKVKLMLAEMKIENTQMVPGYRCCLMGYFMVLMSTLSRLYTDDLSKINEPSFKLGQTISFINSHYNNDIGLDDLIKKSAMSRSTFMRKFHQATGMAPTEFILQTRIAEACRLLLQPNLNITEIAYRVGFNDSNYFTRQFRRIVGTTPRLFRGNKQRVSGFVPKIKNI